MERKRYPSDIDREQFEQIRRNLNQVDTVLVDGSCTGKSFSEGVKERIGVTVIVAKRSEFTHLQLFLNAG